MRKVGRLSHPIQLNGFHHVAYRCKDAKETVECLNSTSDFGESLLNPAYFKGLS